MLEEARGLQRFRAALRGEKNRFNADIVWRVQAAYLFLDLVHHVKPCRSALVLDLTSVPYGRWLTTEARKHGEEVA